MVEQVYRKAVKGLLIMSKLHFLVTTHEIVGACFPSPTIKLSARSTHSEAKSKFSECVPIHDTNLPPAIIVTL
jgi:hypothetical protein